MSVFGIDFGNETCKITTIKGGAVITILNDASKRKNPTLVSFQGKRRLLCENASAVALANYKQTLVNMKRLIGLSWNDPEVQEEIKGMPNSNAFEELPGGLIGCKVQFDEETIVLTPTDAVGMILGKLKDTAMNALDGREVKDCVVSVPVYFTETQRSAMLSAIKIAGLNPLSLINEPTATALDFGMWKNARKMFDAKVAQNYMFVDIGESKSSVTVVSYVLGQLKVLSSVFDRNLGGRTVDDALVDFFAEQYLKKNKGLDPRTNAKSLLKLRAGCEKAKCTLTPEGVNLANVYVECLMEEIDLNGKLSLEEFDTLCEPLLPRLEVLLNRAKQESGVTEFTSVELVGGASRVRIFKRKIAEVMGLFDKSKPNYGLSTTLDIDESVGRGCALQCAILSPAMRAAVDFKIMDYNPYPIRISWDPLPVDSLVQAASDTVSTDNTSMDVDGVESSSIDPSSKNSILWMERGVGIPKSRRLRLRRNQDFEVSVEYDVTATELLPPGYERNIGRFSFTGMPENSASKKGMTRIDFRIDGSGLLKVEQCDLLEEIEVEQTVTKKVKKSANQTEATPAAAATTTDATTAAATTTADDEEEIQVKEMTKKSVKTSLKAIGNMRSTLSPSDLTNSIQREIGFIAKDRMIKETADMRNKLEALIYSTRDRIDGDLKSYATSDESTTIKSAIDAAETWLYDEGFDETKIVYEKRITDLTKLTTKIEFRLSDEGERRNQLSNITSRVAKYLAIVNSTEEKYAHIDAAERAIVQKACEQITSWVNTEVEKQNKQDLYRDPILTAKMMFDKAQEFKATCKPIVEKKAPVKPKAEEPAVPPKSTTPAASGDGEKPKEEKAATEPTVETNPPNNNSNENRMDEDNSKKTTSDKKEEPMDVD